MGKKESKKRSREASTNNRQQRRRSPSKDSRRRSSPHADKNLVETFQTVLDKCNTAPENFQKAKIEPIRKAFEAAKEKDTMVTFVAETGFGKSRMVNAIVGFPVCPVRDDAEVFSWTMLPMIFRHGNRIQLNKKRFSGGVETVYCSTIVELYGTLDACNRNVKDLYKHWSQKDMSLEQDPDKKLKPSLLYDYLEVFIPSEYLKTKSLQVIDFPGMTHEESASLIRDHNRSMLNHLTSEGKMIDAIFIGCHRNAKNPFLAPHEHERKLIDWYGFLTRENIIHTPCICLVDNTWETEIQPVVARLTSHPKFQEYLCEQFLACITGKKAQRISKQALEEVGIASFGEDYSPIFSSFYRVQFWTLYRKEPDYLIPIMRKLFSYIDVHDARETWIGHFDAILDKARSNSIQSMTRELFKRFNSVLQTTKKFRPQQFSAEEGDGTHAILKILRKSTKLSQLEICALLLNYCQSEDLDVEWNDAAEGSNESWVVFVSAFVDRFLFSDASGALIFLYATILFERFQEKTINYFVHELNERLRDLRVNKGWLEDLQRPRPKWFTIEYEAVFRNYATLENINPSITDVVKKLCDKHFFNLATRIRDIHTKVVSDFSDEFAKGITAEVARQMNVIRKEIKPLTSHIMQLIITEEFGTQEQIASDETRIDHKLNPRRFEPGPNATNYLAFCPSKSIIPDLNFNSNDEVEARYDELKLKKVFPFSRDKFYRDAIFFRKHDPFSYQMANLVDIPIVTVPQLAVEARPVEVGDGTLYLNVIFIHINMEAQKVEVPDIDDGLLDRNALVFIPSYLVANNDTQLHRKVNYFLESIVETNDAMMRDSNEGPFFIIVEEWQLDVVVNEIHRQLSKLREESHTFDDIESAIANHFRIVCVRNRHIGVGRARDLCRLMAVHLKAKHFFVLHDDIRSIVEMRDGGTYKDPVVPIRCLRCMLDVLESEYLNFTGNVDEDARVELNMKLQDDLQVTRRELNHIKALDKIVDAIIENPALLRENVSLEEFLKSNFQVQYDRYGNLSEVIRSAFANTCNQAICQVALLSAERQKELLNDASTRRANGYTHALSSMLYECTLYRTDPCRRLSFLSGDSFFDTDSEEHYKCFRDFVDQDEYKEFMPIRGWDRTKIPNTSMIGRTDYEMNENASRDEYYRVLNHSIRYGYRYEDHAFHERLMLRGYTGVVLYNYQMVPFDKQVSSVFDRDSIVADTRSIGANDDDDSEDDLYLSEL